MAKASIDDIRTAMVRSSGDTGRPYPRRMRSAVVALAKEQQRAGVSLDRFAAEIGVSATTLRKWQRDEAGASGGAFCAVEVVGTQSPAASLVVHGPCGLRVEGATVADIAELVRRLA